MCVYYGYVLTYVDIIISTINFIVYNRYDYIFSVKINMMD